MFQQPSWEDDTDEFLKSMLTGSDLSGLGVSGSEAVCPSDTSSDSGCPEEQVRKMLTVEKIEGVSHGSLQGQSTEFITNLIL